MHRRARLPSRTLYPSPFGFSETRTGKGDGREAQGGKAPWGQQPGRGDASESASRGAGPGKAPVLCCTPPPLLDADTEGFPWPLRPSSPCRALKPCSGTRVEPVTNCSSRALRSSSKVSTACQNHRTTLLSATQCFSRVLDFQSLRSILSRPPMMSCAGRGGLGDRPSPPGPSL